LVFLAPLHVLASSLHISLFSIVSKHWLCTKHQMPSLYRPRNSGWSCSILAWRRIVHGLATTVASQTILGRRGGAQQHRSFVTTDGGVCWQGCGISRSAHKCETRQDGCTNAGARMCTTGTTRNQQRSRSTARAAPDLSLLFQLTERLDVFCILGIHHVW
jgi:hypothetical protein